MSQSPRFRPDDLRRLATDLFSRAGLGRERASALGRVLLWYDAVGAHDHGITGLDAWLSRLDRGEFDPRQDGRVGPEHASTAMLEAGKALPPLVLSRAATIAGQKARDTGVGVVRVVGLPADPGPTSAIAADLAIGPYAGVVLGPGPMQASAVPSGEGVPIVYDSGLVPSTGELGPDGGPIATALDRLAPWSLLASGGDVLVIALAVAAFESLGAFHNRVADAITGRPAPDGWIFPETWQRHRLLAQQSGIPVPESSLRSLRERASAAGIAFPDPIG